MTDELAALTQGPSLDGIMTTLNREEYYQAPGGRTFLLSAALIAGVPRGARVIDVGCGLGSAAIDLAEAFACRVVGFDTYAPYVAQGYQTAKARGVDGRVKLRELEGVEALRTYPIGAYDVVVGLGGILNVAFGGGRETGLAAAARWLSPGGVLICSDLIAVAPLSELLRAVLGDDLPTEQTYAAALDATGFDLLFAARATRADWDRYHDTMDRLRELPHPHLHLGDPERQRVIEAANVHPEVGYLNMVARKRA